MLDYLKKIGASPDDSSEQQLRKYTLLLITVSCCVAAPIWALAYYFMGLHLSAIVPLIYVAVMLPVIAVFAYTRNEQLLLNAQLFAIFLCPLVMQWLAGGLMKGGVIILWSFLAPLSALIFHDIGKARFWMVMVILGIGATAFFNDYFEQFGYYIDKSQKILLDSMNVAGATAIVFFTMQYFVRTINKNTRQIENEKQKTDTLLLNILPAQVAEELKVTGKSNPTLYQNTTIIFTDFKDFTQFGELFTPRELISELETCFEKFDEIITRHGLEKIKTMGDAYMCVAGILKHGDNAVMNAVNAVKAAVEIADCIRIMHDERLSQGKVFWDIRIGVHTGDVVGGIVGKKKFAFDIWGDAVNTANRLETNGEEGRVNISGATYKLVKDHFQCTYRGKLPVKNKGDLEMYFVDAYIPEAAVV
jgi:class 3 adenylate cyclase